MIVRRGKSPAAAPTSVRLVSGLLALLPAMLATSLRGTRTGPRVPDLALDLGLVDRFELLDLGLGTHRTSY